MSECACQECKCRVELCPAQRSSLKKLRDINCASLCCYSLPVQIKLKKKLNVFLRKTVSQLSSFIYMYVHCFGPPYVLSGANRHFTIMTLLNSREMAKALSLQIGSDRSPLELKPTDYILL